MGFRCKALASPSDSQTTGASNRLNISCVATLKHQGTTLANSPVSCDRGCVPCDATPCPLSWEGREGVKVANRRHPRRDTATFRLLNQESKNNRDGMATAEGNLCCCIHLSQGCRRCSAIARNDARVLIVARNGTTQWPAKQSGRLPKPGWVSGPFHLVNGQRSWGTQGSKIVQRDLLKTDYQAGPTSTRQAICYAN